jgi:hypothetical protein
VNVTDAPTGPVPEALSDSDVAVPSGLTTWPRSADVLPRKFGVPV